MIKGMNHVGLSVANLDRSVAFYRDVLGMAVVRDMAFDGPLYAHIMALEGATGRLAILEVAGMRVELFEFAHPAPKPSCPNRPVCDHGITHFCVEVVDIEEVYQRLSAAGVSFHCPPLSFRKSKATYARDPDGNVFELVELIHPAKAPDHYLETGAQAR